MKRKFLEDLGLEKEQIDVILDESGKEISRLKESIDEYKANLDEANKTIEDVKTKAENDEELQKQLAEYKAKYEESEANRANMAKDYKLRDALKEAGATDIDYMLFKLGDVEVGEDGEIKDLDNKIKELSESNPTHFATKEISEPSGDGYNVMDSRLTPGEQPSSEESMRAEIMQAMGLQ